MISQGSHIRDEPAPVMEEEWQLISTGWWRTPFGSVSWSYEPPETASRNIICAKPPYYDLSSYNERTQSSFDEECPGGLGVLNEWHPVVEDNTLNQELIGVKSASDALKIYEQAVGFHYSPWLDFGLHDIGDLEEREKLGEGVSDTDLQLGKERWHELVKDLFGGKSLGRLLMEASKKTTRNASEKPFAILDRNIDYFSRPSTPKPFQLNPSAVSFVPLGSPTSTSPSSSSSSLSSDSSDLLASFAFPSYFPSPPSNIADYREYVDGHHMRCRTTSSDSSSMARNGRPSSDFLPAFLFDATNKRRRQTRSSRTRAIVDQLRSQNQQVERCASPTSQTSSPTVSDFWAGSLSYFKSRLTVSDGSSACSTTPPLTEEDYQHHDGSGVLGWTDNAEGWTVPPPSVVADPETKRSRSKELLMTLRRRTDSLTSNANAVSSPAAVRSSSTVPGSTTSAIVVSERLVESPDPTMEVSTTKAVDVGTSAVEDGQLESSNQSRQSVCFQETSPVLGRQVAGMLSPGFAGSDDSHTSSHTHTLKDVQMPQLNPVYSGTYLHTANNIRFPQGYSSPGLPYPLLGYPLPVSGLPVNVGIPMPVTVTMGGAPRVGMQAPVSVPVQTIQYSTLMHLRVMQQMQMVRNNMAVGGASVSTAGLR